MRKATLAVAVTMALGTGVANAALFSMNTHFFSSMRNTQVAGTVNSSTGTGSFNSNGIPEFVSEWTATVAGTFSVLDGEQGVSGINATSWTSSVFTGASATATYNFTLAPGQVAMSLLWDWGTSVGIPVLNIVNADGSGVDIDSDGVVGTKFVVGIFTGVRIGYSGSVVASVPVPASIWLLGSGLVGLVGVACRQKKEIFSIKCIKQFDADCGPIIG